MNLIISRYLHRAKVLEEMNEDWKKGHDEALEVLQFEELLSESLDMAAFLIRSLKVIADSVFDSAETCIMAFDDRLKVIAHAERAIRAFKETMEQADKILLKGYQLKDADKLRPALHRLEHSLTALKTTCPSPDHEMLARTARDIEQGKFRSAEELLNDAKNSGA